MDLGILLQRCCIMTMGNKALFLLPIRLYITVIFDSDARVKNMAMCTSMSYIYIYV